MLVFINQYVYGVLRLFTICYLTGMHFCVNTSTKSDKTDPVWVYVYHRCKCCLYVLK